MFALIWLTGFRGGELNIFPIWLCVKNMFVDGDHLGWRSGSAHTILKFHHQRTIHAMSTLNWLTGYRGKTI